MHHKLSKKAGVLNRRCYLFRLKDSNPIEKEVKISAIAEIPIRKVK
jgi:hypothetical protein